MPYNHSSGDKAVALMASTLVVLGGATSCLFIVLVGGLDFWTGLLACGSCFAFIVWLLWMLSIRDTENRVATKLGWTFWKRRRRRSVQWAMQKKKADTPISPPPAPPTAESVRDIADTGNTWVPSGNAPRRRGR